MKLFIDTNVIMDVYLKREPFFEDSREILARSKGPDECYFSASTAKDVHYLLRKHIDFLKTQIMVGKLFTIMNCIDTQTNDILCALAYDMPDFEDGVIESMAFRIGANYIITRNTKDYKRSRIPALTPAEYLEMVKTS